MSNILKYLSICSFQNTIMVMLKYFSSIGNMFSFSPHVKIFWVTGTMLQTQKIVFPTLHRACSRLALELGGSVDRGMRAAVRVEYDAEAEKPRTSFGVLAPIFPPPPLVLGPEHAANGWRGHASSARTTRHRGGKIFAIFWASTA